MANHSDLYSFNPRKRLRSGHLQTLAGNFLRRQNLLPPGRERIFQVATTSQGEPVRVLIDCHWQAEPERRMTVIIVHGLEGSIESKYVIGAGSKAWAAGMNVLRMNMRNCGGTEKLTPTLYHSGLSGDIGAVVRTLVHEDRLEKIGVIGYSMGGNLAMKLAAEWSETDPQQLKAVATVSPAMDLGISADAMHNRSNLVYEWRFLRNLKARLRRKASLFPGRYDLRCLKGVRSIRDFDHQVTARYEGFTSADDYYTRSSAGRIADRIKIPAMVIHAWDDPFIRMSPETRAKLIANPHVRLVETNHGGHCAFLAESNGYDGRWAERLVVEFLKEF